ncbi:hypothetical protein GCM10027613_40170 [Microlunatus endophyticus]
MAFIGDQDRVDLNDQEATGDHESTGAGLGASQEPSDPDEQPLGSPWDDLRAYISLPRLGSLVLSPTGTLLVSVSELNHDQTAYRSSWWSVDPTGSAPARRFTRSAEGESVAAFLPDGSLVFGSRRPAPPAAKAYGPKPETKPDDSDGVLWLLPAGGERRIRSRAGQAAGGASRWPARARARSSAPRL